MFPYLNEQGHSFGLIHIIDENYDHDLSVYYLDKCILIFRKHIRPSGGITHLLEDYSKSFFLPTHTYVHKYSSSSGLNLLVYNMLHNMKIRFWGGSSVFQFLKRQYLPSLPSNKEIFHIPIGSWVLIHKPKNYSHNQVISERPYKWSSYKLSFCGDSSKKDRELMLEGLKNCHPNFVYKWK